MIYIYSQVLASIIHPRTSLITFHIIHIPFPYYKYVHSCQECRLDWFCGNPAFPTPSNHADRPTNQSHVTACFWLYWLPSPGQICGWAHQSSAWFWCACQLSYFFSGIHAGYHVDHHNKYNNIRLQSTIPAGNNTNPSNATNAPHQRPCSRNKSSQYSKLRQFQRDVCSPVKCVLSDIVSK